MISSFRLRLAVLLAVLSGVALGGFGLASWWMIRAAKQERIDTELRWYAERVLAPDAAPQAGAAAQADLAGSLAGGVSRYVALLVENDAGDVVYQSEHWPNALSASALSWPASVARPPSAMHDDPTRGPSPSASASTPGEAPGPPSAVAAAPPQPVPLASLPAPTGHARVAPAAPANSADSTRALAPQGAYPEPDLGPPPPRPEDQPEFEPGRPAPRDMAGRPFGPPPRRPSEQDPRGRGPLFAPRVQPGDRAERPTLPAIVRGVTPQLQPSTTVSGVAPSVAPLPTALVASASNGSALQITHAARAPLPAQLAAPAPFAAPAVALSDVAADGASWRLALASTEPMRVAIALDNRALAADMVVVRNAFLMAVPPTLLLIALGTWLVAARALRPVDDLTATIRRVSAQGLSERVAASASDSEFAELIGVFNAMLERLERGFHQASRFSADAAHELKTPLAIMQGELERRIGQSETGSETQVAYTRLLDEVTRLSIISRKLLMLSLADAGRLKLDRQPLDMTELLNGLTEDARMLAPELRVTSDIPAGLRVSADHNLIQQILHNLVSNAIKFNTPDGWIHITASRSANEVFVSVSNASHGIDPADARRVFERFYRGDPAHGRAVDGVGLGLSLSREIARAHGGDLTLETGQDARVFLQLVLPDLPNRLH